MTTIQNGNTVAATIYSTETDNDINNNAMNNVGALGTQQGNDGGLKKVTRFEILTRLEEMMNEAAKNSSAACTALATPALQQFQNWAEKAKQAAGLAKDGADSKAGWDYAGAAVGLFAGAFGASAKFGRAMHVDGISNGTTNKVFGSLGKFGDMSEPFIAAGNGFSSLTGATGTKQQAAAQLDSEVTKTDAETHQFVRGQMEKRFDKVDEERRKRYADLEAAQQKFADAQVQLLSISSS